ncbi:hypothetical protein ACFY36_26000 [Actinoplanes sp. NPDC000266]
MTVHDHSTRSSAEPPLNWPPVSTPDDHTDFAGPTASYPTTTDSGPGYGAAASAHASPAAPPSYNSPAVHGSLPAHAEGGPTSTWTPVNDAGGAPPTWTPPENNGGGGDRPGGGRKNAKLAAAGALVAVAVASAGITAGVMAATGSDSSASAQGGPGGGQFPGGGGMNGGGTMGGGTGASTALHGEYVVSDGNGGYTTQVTQTGTVSAVSSSSMTVKSTDGYSQTYVITTSTTVDNGADQISSVATGHTVRVIATSADSKATATSITDTNLASTQQGTQGGTQQGGTQQGGQAPSGMQGGQQGGLPGGGQMQQGQAPGGTGTGTGTAANSGTATGT